MAIPLIAYLLLVLKHSPGRDIANAIANPVTSTTEVDNRPVVIDRIKASSELITTRFYGDIVVPLEKNSTLWGIPVGSTSLLYVASGSVMFGVDLSKIKSDDIVIDGRSITISIPPVVILHSGLDVSKSKTYQAQSDLINATDTVLQLQDQAEQEALSKLVAAACDSVGDVAEQQAKLAITNLVQAMGYNTVTVVPNTNHLSNSEHKSCPSQISNPPSNPPQ
jgi:Protein of unknown function (DUF4230)